MYILVCTLRYIHPSTSHQVDLLHAARPQPLVLNPYIYPKTLIASLHIPTPLRNHPHQTHTGHRNRRPKPGPHPRRTKTQPLARKVRKREGIRPQSQLIDQRIGDVIRRVEAYDRRQECPGAERARRERCHWGRGRGRGRGRGCGRRNGAGVDAAREADVGVAFVAVGYGD